MAMTVEYAIQLDSELLDVIRMLRSIAHVAGVAEAGWQENGDGSVATIWTATQRQQFADLLTHTVGRRNALLNREVAES